MRVARLGEKGDKKVPVRDVLPELMRPRPWLKGRPRPDLKGKPKSEATKKKISETIKRKQREESR